MAQPLIDAARDGDAQLVQDILSKNPGLDLNHVDVEWGGTALVGSAFSLSADCMRILLDHGADPSIPHTTGATAMHMAIINSKPKMVKMLLEHNADPNEMCGSWPALHWACVQNKTPCVKILLENGADPTAVFEKQTAEEVATKPEVKTLVREAKALTKAASRQSDGPQTGKTARAPDALHEKPSKRRSCR